MTSKGGGMAILLQNGINFQHRKDIEVFKEKLVESIVVEVVSKDGKKIIMGSMYRPPNTDLTKFRTTVNALTSKSIEEKKELIVGMDHNLDVLKCGLHRQTQLFFDDLLDKNILLTITHPTRITDNIATLIDYIFVSEKLHKYFESAVILDDISDHLTSLALLKQTKLLDNKPIEFESWNLTANKVKVINQELLRVDWTRHLSTENSSNNFDLLLAKVNEIMDATSPLKKIQIAAKRKYIEPWMTRV